MPWYVKRFEPPGRKPSEFIYPNLGHPYLRDCVGAFYLLEGAGGAYNLITRKYAQKVGASVAWVNEKYGKALDFSGDGNNHRINLGLISSNDPINCNSTQECTIISKVLYRTPSNSYPRIFDKSSSGGGTNGYAFYLEGIYITFSLNGFNRRVLFTAVNNTEYDFAVVAKGQATGNVIDFYIDNELYESTDADNRVFPATATDAAIGNWNHSTDRNWAGKIYYVLVYNRALDADEIKRIGEDPYAPFERFTFQEDQIGGPVTHIGTGALQAQNASVVGVGEVVVPVITGDGALQAQPAAVSGVGDLIAAVEGTGTLQAGDATVIGTGAIVQDGTGTLQAQDAAVVGVGEVGNVRTGMGALQAGDATVTGAGDRTSVGTGALQAQDAAVVGIGEVEGLTTGTGTLQAQPAAVVGAGEFTFDGAGVLQAQPAAVSGIGFNLGELTLTPGDLAAIQQVVWAAPEAQDLIAKVNEIWQRRGLDSTNPQTYDKAGKQIRVGGITIDLTGDANEVTQTRQP